MVCKLLQITLSPCLSSLQFLPFPHVNSYISRKIVTLDLYVQCMTCWTCFKFYRLQFAFVIDIAIPSVCLPSVVNRFSVVKNYNLIFISLINMC